MRARAGLLASFPGTSQGTQPRLAHLLRTSERPFAYQPLHCTHSARTRACVRLPAGLHSPVKHGCRHIPGFCPSTFSLPRLFGARARTHEQSAGGTVGNRKLLPLRGLAGSPLYSPTSPGMGHEGGSNNMEANRALLSVAPMMDWTDVHYRQLARLMSRHTWLYTEMYVDQTLLHNPNLDRFLWFPESQHPIVCQLGGSNPEGLANAARIAESYGYDEINLNCGCPSERVAGAGCFGASLMLQPRLVAECCAAMCAAVSIPVTVKCRLGVDDVDSYEALCGFIDEVSRGSGVSHFIIHARKCILKGLSPADNRTIPPLRHGWVFALRRDFPHLSFSLNGVVESCHHAAQVLSSEAEGARVQGVMIGRAAYNTPWDCLADADVSVFGAPSNAALSRRQVLEQYCEYGDGILGRWGKRPDGAIQPNVRQIVIPLLGMFHAQPGARRWRQAVDKELRTATSVREVVQETIKCIPDVVLDAPPTPRDDLPLYSPGPLPDAIPHVIFQAADATGTSRTMPQNGAADCRKGTSPHSADSQGETDRNASPPEHEASAQDKNGQPSSAMPPLGASTEGLQNVPGRDTGGEGPDFSSELAPSRVDDVEFVEGEDQAVTDTQGRESQNSMADGKGGDGDQEGVSATALGFGPSSPAKLGQTEVGRPCAASTAA